MITHNSYDDIADYLTDGYWEWRGEARRAFDIGPGGVLTANITALTAEGQQLARWALEAWAGVSAIEFEFVQDDNARIIFDDDGEEPVTLSTVNDGVIISSHVNIPADWLTEHGTTAVSFSFTTYLHEIGHALGLGNPGPYPDPDNTARFHHSDRLFQDDSYLTTVMSSFYQNGQRYTTQVLTPVTVTPMIADILAIQNLYGAPDDANAGDTVYGFQSNTGSHLDQFFSLWAAEENPLHGFKLDSRDIPVFIDLDDDGDPDLVVGTYRDRGRIDYYENTGTVANPVFTQRVDAGNPVDDFLLRGIPAPALADLDGDGDPDLMALNSYGNVYYFENTGTAANPDFTERTAAANPLDGMNVGSGDRIRSESKLALADLDSDGDIDLIVGKESGDIDYYENTGTVTSPVFTQRSGAANPLDNVDVNRVSKPALIDLDGDNDQDLVIMEANGTIHYFENTGTATDPGFTERTHAANPLNGITAGNYYASFTFADLDGDQNIELIIVNNRDYPDLYENTGTHTNPDFINRNIDHRAMLTLYDSGGNDTLDLRTALSGLRVELRAEEHSGIFGSLTFAPGTIIENVIGGYGDDHITGNTVANQLVGGPGNDQLWGDSGNDLLEGGAGADRLDGGAGVDTVSYQGSDDGVTIDLGAGTGRGGHARYDSIFEVENVRGSAYGDALTGDGGANRLDGAEGDDVLRGNGGDDELRGGAGADRLAGGAGQDTSSYEHSDGAVTVRLHSGVAEGGDADGDTFTAMVTVEYTGNNGATQQETVPDIEHLRGSAHDDVLAGDSRANRLQGGPGADLLYGGPGGGDDVLRGGPGVDSLFGGIGNDLLEGGPDADTLKGGPGEDTASYAYSDAGVAVRLHSGVHRGGHAGGDVLDGIENLSGSAYADILEGDGSANNLNGDGGDDELRGNGGNDVLQGGAGADRLSGGSGADWVSYLWSDTGVTVNLGEGTGKSGHAQGDTIVEVENVRGSAYRDVLVGNDSANHLEGIGGADELRGNGGNDVLEGGAGDDVLDGGAGADRLDGGGGVDTASYLGSDTGVTINLEEGTAETGYAQGDVIIEVENVKGSGYADLLIGDDIANRLDGGAGADELRGNGGNDVLEGGPGADELDGDAGVDTVSYQGSDAGVTVRLRTGTGEGGHAEGDVIVEVENVTGSDYRDVLGGDVGANRLTGGAGNDGLWGGSGDDVLEGSAGADRLDGGAGMDWVSYRGSDTGVTVRLRTGMGERGHAEGDVIVGVENVIGSDHADVLGGDISANRLSGGDGNDGLWGGSGDDVLEGGAGADRLFGGSGADWVSYTGSDAGITVNLVDGTGEEGHAEGDVIAEVENVRGSGYADLLIGNDDANRLDGAGGDDDLRGNGGDDKLEGGAGSDRLEGGAGADSFDGGAGADTVSYQGSDTGVTVNLSDGTGEGGHGEGDVIDDVENVWGSGYADLLIGDDNANRLDGAEGDDVLRGGGGNDILEGGPGANELEGGAGADQLIGGDGEDWASYEGSDMGVTVSLFVIGSDLLSSFRTTDVFDEASGGDAEGDIMIGIENLKGSDYEDMLFGNDDANRLAGGPGDDELHGGRGDDFLQGDSGRDYLSGEEDDDTLDGGDGHDVLHGGLGGDRLEGGDGDDVLTGDGPFAGNFPFGTNDVLLGGAGDDFLNGGTGDNLLHGGEGADIFHIDIDGGDDVVSDFTDGEDRIDLAAFNLTGFHELTISSDADSVTIDLSAHGGGTVLLEDFDIANLDASDFFF